MAIDTVLEVTGFPVNELGEVVLQAGVGTSSIVGTLSGNFVPRDNVTDRMVVRLPDNVAMVAGPAPVSDASSFALSTLRYEALVKPAGCSANGLAFNQTASLSTSMFCPTVKMEVEGDFDAVKLFAVNRAANAIGSIKALVGVTETADMSTSAKIGSPTINGTTYQALQGAADINGWRAYTWSGAATAGIPAANLAQQVVPGDWVAKSSIPRADAPGSRPFLLYRSFVDGTVSPVAFISSYTTALQGATAANRGRILQASTGYADGIANPALGMTANAASIEIYPALRFRVPVFSVWSCGDSLVQNDGLVADKVSSWVKRACDDLSTQARPVVHANFGASNQTNAVTLTVVKTWLSAGAPPPSCMVAEFASVNDAAYDANLAEQQSSRIMEWVKLCDDYKIPHLVAVGLFPKDSNTAPQDAFRFAMNAKIKALCASVGITFVEFPSLGNGASPERWTTAYRFDDLHFNELAIDTVLAPTLKAVIARLDQ